MRKFIKSVVAAVLVASMSVAGLATMASAKSVSLSQLPKAYYDWASVEKICTTGTGRGDYEAYVSEELAGVPNQILRRVTTLDTMYDRKIVSRDISKISGSDKLTKGDVVQFGMASLHGSMYQGICELFTFADIKWYLKTECDWSDKDCEILKDDAVDYIITSINNQFDNSYSNAYHADVTETGYVTRPYTQAEAEKYWDKIVMVFDKSPCVVNERIPDGMGYRANLNYINIFDMKDDQVYYDLAGRSITKADVFSGTMATGYYCDGATKNAQKILNGEKVSTTPTLTKSAKIAKTQLNKVMKGLKDGSVKMTTAEYKALKKIYQNADMPSSVISGKTFNKNLKIALVQKLRYALPYMSNAQVKSLRVQLAGILA